MIILSEDNEAVKDPNKIVDIFLKVRDKITSSAQLLKFENEYFISSHIWNLMYLLTAVIEIDKFQWKGPGIVYHSRHNSGLRVFTGQVLEGQIDSNLIMYISFISNC